MAIKTVTITAEINEPDGSTTSHSITMDYDNSSSFTWTDIDFKYVSSADGGPVMRPKKPR